MKILSSNGAWDNSREKHYRYAQLLYQEMALFAITTAASSAHRINNYLTERPWAAGVAGPATADYPAKKPLFARAGWQGRLASAK
jgi:hypothetical protein